MNEKKKDYLFKFFSNVIFIKLEFINKYKLMNCSIRVGFQN